MNGSDEMKVGVQPLDKILNDAGLKNSDLVRASAEQLNHKMVQKGRKGRRLTVNIQMKIVRALNRLNSDCLYSREQLFNY